MGWFKYKYHTNEEPKMPIHLYTKILDRYGEDAANQTLCDVQDGLIRPETIEKYWPREK